MKKIIVILAAAMSILAVASCGSKEHKYTENPSILVYSITTGKGLLSATTGAGRWEMSADGKTLSLTPYDYEAGAYAETPTRYEIVELTADKLVWKEEGSRVTKTFVAE